MSSTETMNKSFNVFLIILFSTFLILFVFHFLNDNRNFSVASCNKKFHFDEFKDVVLVDKETKKVSDKFLSELLELNRMRTSTEYCATSIKNKDNCVQYFQPEAAAGGDARVCINPKAKTLVSVEFGE